MTTRRSYFGCSSSETMKSATSAREIFPTVTPGQILKDLVLADSRPVRKRSRPDYRPVRHTVAKELLLPILVFVRLP